MIFIFPYLGSGSLATLPLRAVSVGADLPVVDSGLLLTDSLGGGVTELVVDHVLDGQLNGSGVGLESGNADLGVDGGVGVSAVELWGVAVAMAMGGRMVGKGHQGEEGEKVKGLTNI